MTYNLQTLRQLQDQRVRMCFTDGHQVVALLLSATEDLDGSLHLVYDSVQWTNQPGVTYGGGPGTAYYAQADTLLSIEPAGEPLA